MTTVDWRTQLPPGSRSKIINKIVDTLKKHLPFSGAEELTRIATKFEEKMFNNANNQTDYIRQISLKMLTMETRSRKAAGSAPSVYAANDSILPPLGLEASVPNKEPAVNTDDWRTQQPLESRQKNINDLMETLKKNVPYSGQEGIADLMRIAVSFEELIFNTSFNQVSLLFGSFYFHMVQDRFNEISKTIPCGLAINPLV